MEWGGERSTGPPNRGEGRGIPAPQTEILDVRSYVLDTAHSTME